MRKSFRVLSRAELWPSLKWLERESSRDSEKAASLARLWSCSLGDSFYLAISVLLKSANSCGRVRLCSTVFECSSVAGWKLEDSRREPKEWRPAGRIVYGTVCGTVCGTVWPAGAVSGRACVKCDSHLSGPIEREPITTDNNVSHLSSARSRCAFEFELYAHLRRCVAAAAPLCLLRAELRARAAQLEATLPAHFQQTRSAPSAWPSWRCGRA